MLKDKPLLEEELCAVLMGKCPQGIPKEADIEDITVKEQKIPLAVDVKRSKNEKNVNVRFSSFKIM